MRRRDPNDVAALVAAVRRAAGVDRERLAELARDVFANPTLPTAVVDQLVEQATADGQLAHDNGRVHAANEPAPDRPAEPAAPAATRLHRAVAIDFESVPRQIAEPPYVDRVAYQVGVYRFGTDTAWCARQPVWRRWIRVDEATAALIRHTPARDAVTVEGRPAAEVAVELAAALDGADVLVAYNGVEVDFPVLERLLAAAELRLPGLAQVDGLYLAHAIWPARYQRSHRLFDLAGQVGMDLDGLQAHDAADDAQVLAQLVETAAATVGGWPRELVELVAAVAGPSPAWRLLLTLAGLDSLPDRLAASEVRSRVGRLFEQQPSLRPGRQDEPEPGPVAVTVPASVQVDGRVDPGRLVSAIRGGGRVETRPAQSTMAGRIRQAAVGGHDVLIEAPTGTGKTAAMLAAALDHLAADPANRVVISTYTKQLQAQLATDLQALTSVLDGLAVNVDLVKGARNRLSLRALVVTLAGLAGADGVAPRMSSQPRFRDTVLYLLLRRLAVGNQGALTDTWDARSVDTADLPAFFDRYCGGALPGWLVELSQGRGGDFRSSADDVLADHTRLAREAVQQARLVVANHALLFSNVSAFEHTAGTTMLLVDEAHRVEDAATSTFEASFDSVAVEAVATDLARYRAVAAGSDQQRAVLQATVARLDELLDAEQLPKAVGHVVDVHGGGDLLSGRQLRRGTVAAAEADAITLRRGETVFGPLSTLRTALSDCWQALDALPEPSDAAARDLHHGLRSRLLDTLLTVATVRRDLGGLLGLTEAADELDTGEVVDELGVDPEQPPPDASNRVVWATEVPSPDFAARGWRWFRFSLVSSPVTLADEPRYRDFRATFPTSVFVSATLQVAEAGGQGWRFIRDRLGLDTSVDAVTLDSPFDPAEQARLVCFEDFPSWAEQAEGAVRTLAHQLTGYATEVVGADGSAGAMLLTTSRAAAAEVSDLLLRARSSAEGQYDIHSAVLTDNRTAVERFKSSGGILTGTKGLWQGVDIDQPERLRLVWVNKLPFPAVGDPVLEQRMARLRTRAEASGAKDPESAGLTELYLPLAAIDLRQAVGRLLRSGDHRGVVVISDAKLAGNTVLRRTYRQVFLGSLDPGFRHRPAAGDPADPADPWGGNVVPMEIGWQRIFTFLAEQEVIGREQAQQLCQPDRLAEHVWLPQTRTIREQELTANEEADLATAGQLGPELLRRAIKVGGALRLSDQPVELKPKQVEALDAVARGDDLLAVLPTGYGKSFTFQLPALVLPGVTLVLSPLVSLMTDQALHLNRTIGGAVRALTGPMRESNSRLGKAEVAEQLTDPVARHGIRLIYLSPERLAHRQFRDQVRQAVRLGIVRRIAVDEAHTLAQWGDDFRPQFRRAERFVRELRRDPDLPRVQLLAVTATATRTVREHLRRWLFDHDDPTSDPRQLDGFSYVTANPVRCDLAVYRRQLPVRDWSKSHYVTVGIVEKVLERLDGHAIVYAMTVREVDALHGYLFEQAGTTRTVLRYHGRMPETEKAAVADAFINAPRHGDEGFKPMVVVATAAFGLGVDRPDIRTVLLASPPMDLAALYQQLGRAGRDQVGNPPEKLDKPAIGMALLTGRGWSTLRFFFERRPEREQVLTQIAERILTSTDPYLDPARLALQVMEEEVCRGLLDRNELDNPHVRSAYRTMVLRVFAALASSGHVEDEGDFPMRVSVSRGQVTVGDAAETATAILAAAGTSRQVALLDLWGRLDPQLHEQFGDPGALWTEMTLLHAAGYLDVSQRANIGYGMTTGYRKLRGTVDPDLARTLLAHLRTTEGELAELRAWFDPAAGRCVNDDLARYFAVDSPPDGTCSVQANRCSTCWDQAAVAEQSPPPLHSAFFVHDPAPASKVASHRKSQQARLDATITRLAKLHPRGFTASLLLAVLRGEPSFRTRRGPMDVFSNLRLSRYYGSHPGTSSKPLDAAVDRLTAAGVLGRNDRGFLCHTSYFEPSEGTPVASQEAGG